MEITGVALFDSKKEKMIQTLTLGQGHLIQSLQGTSKVPPLTIKLDENSTEEERLVIDLITSKEKIKGNKNIDDPHITVEVTYKGALTEYSGDKDLDNKEDFVKLEEQIGEYLTNQTIDLLDELKDLEVDPIGLSENFRMYHEGEWTDDLTKQIVSKAQFEVSVKIRLLNVGSTK